MKALIDKAQKFLASEEIKEYMILEQQNCGNDGSSRMVHFIHASDG